MTNIMTFEDSVKERLKSIVADLIPEERWETIVRATVREFETKDLPALVKTELANKYKEIITAELAKPEWQGRWNMVGPEASEVVSKMLIDAAPLILASMIGGQAQQLVSNLQYSIQNQRY